MTVDQPLFNLAKKNQLTFFEFLGEDRFAVLLGGLHIEMALWSTLSDLMLGSGWPESLKDAGIVNSLAAGMCLLKAVNVMRTRYAPQNKEYVQNDQQAIRDSSVIFVAPYWQYRISCLKVQLAPLAQGADSEK